MGPCDRKNVIGIITKEKQLWSGSLKENDEYAELLEWFKASAQAGQLIELPSQLKDHSFERFVG